ncbi:scavenger receptor class B member 1 isoform X1 [Dendroctonus ponderosae]|uniref:Scavenger receptor class B member 1 n=2 Tax=Dendroctonus ponderosae TaxID=77166 RepID=U4UXH0_DENPD|nr:scavenger receptor class B member 1 isoform X1 [Dendroctonus ponderosae]ERL95041.1 hypothetical protein D910_12311 [Dendroctonus ponderosae]KAH1018291.1 hypothetical protein HUJ05_006092 [Dendroctonus ponderosae]
MLDDSLERSFAPRRHSNLSDLEKNCSQIFVKAPAITREFFEKINNDVVPQKTAFFGYQMNTRRVIVLTGLMLLFTFSAMGTVTMWFTNMFQKRIESMMVLSEDAPTYEMWKKPPVHPPVKIYIFNYTNVEDFEMGRAKKLHVEELGPYVYFEEMERVNVRFSKVDGTVSYQEKRSYRFSPELSKGSKDDVVIVPNVPLLAGAAIVQQFNFIMRLGYQGIINALSESAFTAQTAHNFIIGYDDRLYELAKSYLKYEDKPVFENFGILVWKKGIRPDVFTLNTGAHDINKLGQVEKFNGQTHYEMWGSESCNNLQGSDGLIYRQDLVRARKDLDVFIPQMCRKLPMRFAGEERLLDKVPVYRYKVPLDVFDAAENADNQCYCGQNSDSCPPKGLFNATSCLYGAPLFYSHPHLYGAEPRLIDAMTGLNPNPVINDTFLDVHPKFGMLIRGKLKIQINVQVKKSFGLSVLNDYPDGLILPMVWVDYGIDEKQLPASVVELIYQITFTIRNLELGLKYGCLLATMVTFTFILLVFKKHQKSRSRVNSMRRPITIRA